MAFRRRDRSLPEITLRLTNVRGLVKIEVRDGETPRLVWPDIKLPDGIKRRMNLSANRRNAFYYISGRDGSQRVVVTVLDQPGVRIVVIVRHCGPIELMRAVNDGPTASMVLRRRRWRHVVEVGNMPHRRLRPRE